MKKFCGALITVFLLITSINISASDYEKEKRWAEQVTDALFDGEPIYLTANDHDFLALQIEPSDQSNTGIILMHGTGVHPDWSTVINPLRVLLAENGYHTLSIQMPVLKNEAEHKDYVELFPQVPGRIDASINHLSHSGITKIYLIGHSLGAAMGTFYLRHGKKNVEGFIAIGLSSGIEDTDMDNISNLTTIEVPVLDLYGSEDLQDVMTHAVTRKKASQHNSDYTQIKVETADHFFESEEQLLFDEVSNWLNAHH